MITTEDVIRAVNSKLKEIFPDNPVCSTDIRQNIEKGSFYVETPFPVIERTSSFQIENGTIRIDYFPKNDKETRIDYLEKIKNLNAGIGIGLQIDELHAVAVSELEFSENDGWLTCSFDYTVSQIIEETGEPIEELEIGG